MSESHNTRPPVAAYLLLWVAWLFLLVAAALTFVSLITDAHDLKVKVLQLVVALVFLDSVATRPPWRLPLPERWARR